MPRACGISIRIGLRLTVVPFAASMVISLCGTSFAQEPAPVTNRSLQEDVASLKRDVESVLTQQREILQQLDELKHWLPTNPPLQPAAEALSSLEIRGDNFRGDVNARVAMVEYADFECPYCRKHELDASPQILANYVKNGGVKLFYHDLPLPTHPHAMQSARAVRCAGEQGKYWEMHDNLFADQRGFSDPALINRAKTLGLDEGKFAECLSGQKYTDDIQKSISEAQALRVDGTPTFFVGTIGPDGNEVTIKKRIEGTHPYEVFKSALDEVLASLSQQSARTD